MATTDRKKLNALYTLSAPGAPLTSKDLVALGISADLAVYYVRAGWLKRLAPGVFLRANDRLDLHPSLAWLQRQMVGLHVGGKTALDWFGVRHYLSQAPLLQLYGASSAKLPPWFTEAFPASYHRKRLFAEVAQAPMHVGPHEGRVGAPLVSAPERALLEMLSEVGVRQPLQEARELIDSTFNLRAGVLQELLQHCQSVKTVRLCLQLGKEAQMPWIGRLDVSALPTGSQGRWVARTPEGLLVLQA